MECLIIKKYKPLSINQSLPEDLEIEINRYLDYLNSGDTGVEDCYQTEVNVALNWCRREHLLTEDNIIALKNYYVFGGIHKGIQNK